MLEDMAEAVRPVIKWTPNKCEPSSLSRKLKKITTPQPFKLSSHDCVSKNVLRSCKHEQVKLEMEERQKNIAIEHVKQFRANPVPPHTFLPLFHQIQREKAQQREFVKEQIKVQLIAKQKPFDLSCYKEPVRRCFSVSDLSSTTKENHGQHFRATPLPKNHSGKLLLEIMAEQDILREVRLRRRAEELIRSSALPFSIPRDAIKKHKIEDAVAKERVSWTRSAPTTSKQKRQHCVRQNTLKFEISSDVDKTPPKTKVKYGQKMALQNREILNRRRSNSVSALNCTTPRMTYSAILREQAIREKRCKENSEIQHLPSEKQNELLKMKRDLFTKITSNYSAISKEERLRHFRENTQVRMKEYQQEMDKMAERVKSRPFLLERQSQLSAIHKLDKKFRELLERQGLDEDFIFANSKPNDTRYSASNASYESVGELPNSGGDGTKRQDSESESTPSDSSKYGSDAITEDESHPEVEDTNVSDSDQDRGSQTELPERDLS